MATRISKREYEALAAFRYALRQFLRFSEDAAHSMGLTPQQHQVLLAIKGFPGRDRIRVGELAERLQLRHHSVVGLVDRLVAQGLVVRESSTEDRRQVLVALTPDGMALLDRLAATHRNELRKVGPELIGQLEELIEEKGDTKVNRRKGGAKRSAATKKGGSTKRR